MSCGDPRHMQRIHVTNTVERLTESAGEYLIPPLGKGLIGRRVHVVVIDNNVERTPEFESWLDSEVLSRVILKSNCR